MPPRIVVEDVSTPSESVSHGDSGSITSWKSSTTLRVEEKGAKQRAPKNKPDFSLKTWWSNSTQPQPDVSGSPNWKPLSMTTPILSAVIIASLLMIAGIELLAQKSQQQGGLALSPSLKEIPQYAMISSQYIPQVLAVCYSLVWSWIDLDVKRMQPWFEMSKPEGALAEDSLLLDYPYTFVAFVPFKAVQRKHWMVFLSGFTMVLVFWAITPLQSAQLGTDSVLQSVDRDVYERSTLMPLAEQEALLGPGIMNLAYAIAWLEQPFPAFTTPNAAYLPFYANETTPVTTTTKTNWTSETTRLSTELNCWPAEISSDEFTPTATLNFLNGQGCNASVTIPQDFLSMNYIGYYSSPHSSFWLANSELCPPDENVTHQFLATWIDAKGFANDPEPMTFNSTGAYCQTKYWKQQVRITIDVATLKPDEDTMEILSEPKALQESEFNSTAFEYLIANGMDSELKTRDYPETFVVEQSPRIAERNLSIPTSNMVPFAFARNDRPNHDFSSPEALGDLFNVAHKYLFSFAVSQLLVNSTEVDAGSATSTSFMSGIVVSRSISAALESLIGLIVVFTGLMVWICRSSNTNLDKNPSSIQRLAEICQNEPRILDLFSSTSHSDDKALCARMKDERYYLVWNEAQECPYIHVDRPSEHHKAGTKDHQQGYYDPVKPAALRLESGIAFLIAVLGVIGGLIYLKWAEVAYNGLKKPSSNQEVQQLLESFIPTMLSTMIEPFWVLINRLMCVLQPFKDLWKGQAKSDNSISTTYTSIPPQFVVWRALKSRHFILPVVCSAVFLANILTISLPAIFKDAEIEGRYDGKFAPMVATVFQNSSIFNLSEHVMRDMKRTAAYEEHKYSALANMSMGTPLLPWVTDDYFFQPWKINNTDASSKSDAGSYTVTTRGYGVDINCTTVPASEIPLKPRVEPLKDPAPGNCGNLVGIAKTSIRENTVQNTVQSDNVGGPYAIEYASTIEATSAGTFVYECESTLTLGWGRTSARLANGTIPKGAIVEASFAICSPIFQTALFEVDVDVEGHILSYNRTSEITQTLDYPDSEKHTEKLIATANGWLRNIRGWHNGTFSEDWLNYLLTLETGSRRHLDPAEPVPDPEELVISIEVIYRKLFNLILGLQYEYLFEPGSSDESTQGHVRSIETRLFLDQPAFIISMVMLVFNIAVALLLYTRGNVFVLPRMPTALGSLIAYIAPSRMMEEVDFRRLSCVDGTSASGPSGDRTFGFGRFIGRDGHAHVGIEMEPNVVRIDPTSVGKGKRQMKIGVWTGTGSSEKLSRAQTWL